ncbi:MAG: glycosyltransferase, partial [Deltaproteobacteria bacterium]|nr:glycosyltransferase [Deltaproteobacteria bacterium]
MTQQPEPGEGMTRLGIFVTHPIQYFAPMWRALAAAPGLELSVHFFSDHSVAGGVDPGFKVAVSWDVPLLDGYGHEFIRRDGDLAAPRSMALPDARERITPEHFDVVMIHGYMYAFERQVLRAARADGVRVLMRGELNDLDPIGGRSRVKVLLRDLYLRWFYAQVDLFCYMDEEARRHLLRLGVPESKLFFSPYSVDSALFEEQRQSTTRGEARAALGIDDDARVLLFSGKLITRKAPMLLCEALKRSAHPEKVVLIVLGEGEEREAFEREARALLGDRLLMPGFVNQSQLGPYFVAADVFVMPSLLETWGLVVDEAMHFGLPVVTGSM